MRARYICAAHCGQSGRALIGAFSSVYSENVICDSPFRRRESRTLSHRTPDRAVVGDVLQYHLFPCGLCKTAHFPGLWITDPGTAEPPIALPMASATGVAGAVQNVPICLKSNHWPVRGAFSKQIQLQVGIAMTYLQYLRPYTNFLL
jgi:hypothetical protein